LQNILYFCKQNTDIMKIGDFIAKFKSRMLWGNLLAMAGVLVLLCVGMKFGLDIYTHHGQAIKVPDLKGMDFTNASELLEGDGLVAVVADSGYNKRLPANCVLAQVPEPGSTVKQGHTIYVTLNSPSSPTVTIPDLVDNSSSREATAKLKSLGFRLLEPKYVLGEKDWVYGIECHGRSVSAGDQVSIEQPLTLLVGSGMADEADEFGSVDEYGADSISTHLDNMADPLGEAAPM